MSCVNAEGAASRWTLIGNCSTRVVSARYDACIQQGARTPVPTETVDGILAKIGRVIDAATSATVQAVRRTYIPQTTG